MGIDPGSVYCGCAFLYLENQKPIRVRTELIKAPPLMKMNERIVHIGEKIRRLITETSPTEIVIESLIFVKNPKALMALAQARGAILSALGTKYVNNIHEYSPNLAKSIVTGHGHADKEMVQKGINLTLGSKLTFASFDESDALLLAMAHWLSTRSSLQRNTHDCVP
jgi:crossover junction endodeoxyribonuclease RuvC